MLSIFPLSVQDGISQTAVKFEGHKQIASLSELHPILHTCMIEALENQASRYSIGEWAQRSYSTLVLKGRFFIQHRSTAAIELKCMLMLKMLSKTMQKHTNAFSSLTLYASPGLSHGKRDLHKTSFLRKTMAKRILVYFKGYLLSWNHLCALCLVSWQRSQHSVCSKQSLKTPATYMLCRVPFLCRPASQHSDAAHGGGTASV